MREFASAIRAARPDAEINTIPGTPPHVLPSAAMNIDRARADVGYEPEYTPQRAVPEYLDWLAKGNER